MLAPETIAAIRLLADDLQALFAPPELIPGCEVLSVADKDLYAADNGWIETRVGQHNQQRCRWRGQFAGVDVGDFVDVLFFASYRLFVVFGQGGSGAAAGPLGHSLLGANHIDTLAGSVVAGDVIYGNATPKWTRRAKGTDGQVLTLVAGLPDWVTPEVSQEWVLNQLAWLEAEQDFALTTHVFSG